MAYLSLYRKYRSQSFDELEGQDHVIRTLQNAIRAGKISHAYLFCGPRGTGKTSTARLLAKAVNCDSGPTPEPCNQCPACTQITEGRHLDVKEMDAASNRGINDIRDLRDTVAFAPAEGRYTVYIIDEVHQLTPEAFNALLKTLEEPPPHVLFVLATTEAHEVPATIVSRCQKFEFRRASVAQLKERIAAVAKEEGVQINDGALELLAREANGGWRDALSLLEQVLAYTDGAIGPKEVYTVLGTVEADVLYGLAAAIHLADGAIAFNTLDELISEGKDPRQLLRDLTAHYRNLMLAAAGRPIGDADSVAKITEQARTYGTPRLLEALQVLAQTEREARHAEQPLILLELAIGRLMSPRPAGASVQQSSLPPPVASAGEARPTARTGPTRPTERPREAPPSGNGASTPEPPTQPLTLGDARYGKDEDVDLSAFDTPAVSKPDSPKTAAAAHPRTPTAPSPAPPSGPAAPVLDSPDLGVIRTKWRVVLEELRRDRRNTVLATTLADTTPDQLNGGELVIRFPSRMMADMFQKKGRAHAEPLEQAILRVTGCQVTVRGEFGQSGGGGGAAPGRPSGPSTRPVAPAPKPVNSTPAAKTVSRDDAPPPAELPLSEPPPEDLTQAADVERAPAPPTLETKRSVAPPRPPAPAATPVTGDTGNRLVHNVLEVFDGRIMEDEDPMAV